MKLVKKKKKYKKYVNPFKKNDHRNFYNWLGFCMGLYNDRAPRPTVPQNFQYPQKNHELKEHLPHVTWINHSTFLIEVDGLRILTDPIWSNRCSPISFVGPKRQHAPGKLMDELPKIDFVFISHNHYDHLDRSTVRALNKKFPKITWKVPKGLKKWFKRMKVENVLEFDWWDSHKLDKNNMTITAVPSQHFSGRHPFNVNMSPWNGYVIEFHNMDKTLYFAGDTGYNNIHFNEIGNKFSDIDLSLIPIGAYSPKKFMQAVHVSPDEAVHIHREINSKLSVGSHHSTFSLKKKCISLSKEKMHQPPFDQSQCPIFIFPL